MAKKKRGKKDFDKEHLRNIKAVQTRVDRAFAKATEEAALIGASIHADLPDDKIFSFDDYPKTREQVDAMLQELRESVEVTIVNGVTQGWDLSNEKNDELTYRVFGGNADALTAAQKQRYFNNHSAALSAFIARKTNGLGLSDRVWNYSNSFKSEVEMALDLGIRSGESAASMTRSLRNYLKYPDMLFRRVRDKHGLLRLSQAAKDFHPGRGVYRSSYKNARRLAATETNIAYRTADHLRWQQMDFVVGIEVLLSNNHTILLQPGETTDDPTQLRKDGTPKANAVRRLYDICDELKGRYPKDFKFTGWHPNCRCYAVSILKTFEEVAEGMEREARGEEPSSESVNTVHDTPEAFDKWVRDHADKIKSSKSVPYFIRDNQQRVDRLLGNIDSAPHYGNAMKLGRSARKKAAKIYEDAKPPILSDKQSAQIKELAKNLGIGITPMSFNEADSGQSNIIQDSNNCQSCVIAHEARLRGLNVTAVKYDNTPTSPTFRIGERFQDAFISPRNGKTVEPTIIKNNNSSQIISKLEKQITPPGRYIIGYNPKGTGHVIIAERFDSGDVTYYCPQKNDLLNINAYNDAEYFEVLKIDGLLFNKKIVTQLITIL